MGIMSIALKALSYGKRALKVAPEFFLGDSAELVGIAMRKKSGSIFTKAKAGAKALEKSVIKKSATQGNFAKRVLNNLFSTPSTIKHFAKMEAQAAKAAGKSALLGGLKGVGKGIAKKMPFIGAAITIAMEAPNIYRAFKDGGVGAGLKEIGGAAVELGGMAAGAAIGTAICPGIGTIIGGIIGGIAGTLIRGKTFTEKQAEAKAQEQLPQYTPEDIARLQEYGFTMEEIQKMQESGYTIEQIEKVVQEEMGKTDPNEDVAPKDNTQVEKPEISEVTPAVDPEKNNSNNPFFNPNPNYTANMMNPFSMGMNSYMSGMMNPYSMGMNPYMSGMMNPYSMGMNTYMSGMMNPYSGSLFQMNYSNPFSFNPQNQYFRYTC